MKQQSVSVVGGQIGLPVLLQASCIRSRVASRVGWHSHQGFEILFALEGATVYEFARGETVELRGGHFLVIPPRLVHRGMHNVRAPSTICGLAIQGARPRAWKHTTFEAEEVAHLLSALAEAGRRVHPFDAPLRWLVRRLMEETTRFSESAAGCEARIALRSLICTVLVEVLRQLTAAPAEPQKYVAAAIEFLQQHLHEPVRTADLVRHVGFSRARLFDLFRSQTGLTPKDYLQRLRVEHAKEQLRRTSLSVTHIAQAMGFSSSQYFSTVFGRYTGSSPSDFRKRGSDRGRSAKGG